MNQNNDTKSIAQTNRDKYGSDYYQRIGRLGGIAPRSAPRGFAADRERARAAGRKGGATPRKSRI